MFYNPNEQRKREMENAYKDSMQMQQYDKNKSTYLDKASGALGKLQGGYNSFKAGQSLLGNNSAMNGLTNNSALSLGNKMNAINGAGNGMGVGGGLTVAKGAMDVGSDLQKGDYGNAGLDAAKTAASFFGPWGMLAAAGISAYQGIKAKQNQKAQKAAMKGMEELQKADEQANNKKSQAMQAMEQENQENDMAVDAMAEQQQSANDMKQDMANQVFYPQYQPTNIQEQQLNTQPVYTQSNSQMSSSPIAQEIMSQVQQPSYTNQYSPYSSSAIDEEIRRRGLQ